jgi:hypothetical protein
LSGWRFGRVNWRDQAIEIASDTGKDMGQITRTFKDEAVSLLRKDDHAFVRVSVSLDPRFSTPSFEDFLRVKLLDNMVPLTEQATHLQLQGG